MLILAQQTTTEHSTLAVVLWIVGFIAVYVVLILVAIRIGRRRWATMDRIAAHLGGVEQQLTRIAEAIERQSKSE